LQLKNLIETHRSFINTWECDENAHMNVQFYLHKFDEAARIFHFQCGSDGGDYRLPATRHVRYHSETVASECTLTRSTTIAEGPMAGYDVHLLEDAQSGTLFATAIDAPSGGKHGSGTTEDHLKKALPRSFDAAPAIPKSADEILALNGLLASQTVVQPYECDANGFLLERAIVSRFTDAAPHVWNRAGISNGWLAENGYGRVAVEMKITHHEVPRIGVFLIMYSTAWIETGKIIRLRHEMIDAVKKRPVVTGDVAAMVMDLTTRKSVTLPKEIFA
jgi:acyl-CoA thioester hydrolase